GHPQIHGISDVGAQFKAVVTGNFRHVVHKLELPLELRQRTVATIVAETVTKLARAANALVAAARFVDVDIRHAGRIKIVQIQPGNARVLGRTAANPAWCHYYVISHVAESKLVDQSWTCSVCPADRNALVQGIGMSANPNGGKLGPPTSKPKAGGASCVKPA